MLLEDGAAAGVRVSGGPVHGHPHPEGLAVRTLSGGGPLPDQTSQRYASKARLSHLLYCLATREARSVYRCVRTWINVCSC